MGIFFSFGWIGFGKEKQESLAGAYLFSVTRFFFWRVSGETRERLANPENLQV